MRLYNVRKLAPLSMVMAVLLKIVLSSYSSGFGTGTGNDGTGSTGATGCSCHSSSASSAISISISLDSSGTSVSQYYPGVNYSVIVAGSNLSGTTLPKFGFQVGAVRAIGAGTPSATDAGFWATGSSLPTGTQYTTLSSAFHVVEHTTALTSASGSGGYGTTYSIAIPWRAPAVGTGSVKFFAVINAVSATYGSGGGDQWNNTNLLVTEAAVAGGFSPCGTMRTSHYDTTHATTCEGTPFSFASIMYTHSGTYTDTLYTIYGCDSLVTLSLTVLPTYGQDTVRANICSGGIFRFGDTVYDAEGTYRCRFLTTLGCDSIVTLILQKALTNSDTFHVSICKGNTYIVGSDTISVSGVYTKKYTNVVGCDSFSSLALSVDSLPTFSLWDTICLGSVYEFGDTQLTSTGQYCYTTVNTTGCDSTTCIELTVVELPKPIVQYRDSILETTPYTSYQWYFDGESILGSNRGSYKPTKSGKYNVAVMDRWGCYNETIAEANVILGSFLVI